MIHYPLVYFSGYLLGFFIFGRNGGAYAQGDSAWITDPGFSWPAISTVMGNGYHGYTCLACQQTAAVVELA